MPVSSLLHDLSRWREQLARSIARNPAGRRSREIALEVNRILGSLMFLSIAEDRGLLEAGTLQQIREADDALRRVSALFREVPYPWTGSFADAGTHRTAAELPVIDDRVIGGILERLCEPDRPYHFAHISTETLAELFAQYFAHTIRRSGTHRAVIVETAAAARSRGTPPPSQEIIAYMVHQSLAGIAAARSPDTVLPLRVLDPACGTGRVLLCAYQEVLDHAGGGRHTPAERQDHLSASVYGVDTDPDAIAVAKMLLVFKLFEPERAATLPAPFLQMAGSVFRDLGRNLLCGNALIGADIEQEDGIAFCPAGERRRLAFFDWQDSFPEAVHAGGFDAVLSSLPGGPPEPHALVQRYLQRCSRVYHPQADRSAYLIERGLALLSPGGMLGCVTDNRWLRAQWGSPVRKHLLRYQIEEIADFGRDGAGTRHPSLCIVRISRRPPSRAFFAVQLDPSGAGSLEMSVRARRFALDQGRLGEGGWTLRDTRAQEIRRKVRSAGTPLPEVVMGPPRPGIVTGLDEAFVIDARQRNELINASADSTSLIRPFPHAGGITRYGAVRPRRFLIFIPAGWTRARAGNRAGWRWFRKTCPAIAQHLKPFAERAKERKHQGDFWWECACDPGLADRHRPRILFPVSGAPPCFTMDAGAAMPDPRTQFIISSNLFLLGILNSRLSAFFTEASGNGLPETRQKQAGDRITALPIYTPDFDNPADAGRHGRLVALVAGMLALHRHLGDAATDQEKRFILQEIESTDRQIDSLVYGLYGLTVEEIALVEESVEQ